MAVQIVADFLLFEQMQVSLYELDAWLADEVRQVMNIYLANHKTG
jgi:hypothetical protein